MLTCNRAFRSGWPLFGGRRRQSQASQPSRRYDRQGPRSKRRENGEGSIWRRVNSMHFDDGQRLQRAWRGAARRGTINDRDVRVLRAPQRTPRRVSQSRAGHTPPDTVLGSSPGGHRGQSVFLCLLSSGRPALLVQSDGLRSNNSGSPRPTPCLAVPGRAAPRAGLAPPP